MTDEERQKLVADLREFTGLDNEPWLVRVGRDAANEIERLAALAQSDAPWQCPIGIPPESHSICSAGTCWWCLADRVKAQSDAEPESYGDQLRRVMKRQAMQSDAEPVVLDPIMWEACECLAEWADIPNVTKYAFSIYKRTLEVLPRFKAILDAAPPRPDASAGLIEAAEELADLMDDVVRGNYKPDSFTTQPLRRALRARAADRNGA